MKLFYKPFALIASIVASRLGKGIFKSLWARIDSGDPPSATAADAGLGRVVAASALEAATMAAMSAMADRAAARTFQYLTGYWAGEQTEEEKKKG
ncbi:MAG TPA: DUF4235 domain-containing protein [Solirubrobacteraceae bacterium]|nr:DUF4235 domain-containing protein [Solirubrobacteraceae bacterium]